MSELPENPEIPDTPPGDRNPDVYGRVEIMMSEAQDRAVKAYGLDAFTRAIGGTIANLAEQTRRHYPLMSRETMLHFLSAVATGAGSALADMAARESTRPVEIEEISARMDVQS